MRAARRLRFSQRVHAVTLAMLVGSASVLEAQAPDEAQPAAVVVMPFEFAAPLPTPRRVVPPPHYPMWPPLLAPRIANRPASVSPVSYPAEETGRGSYDAIGIGVADLLVERLLEIPGIRVVERRRLDLLLSEHRLAVGDTAARRDTTVLRARYIITGSVTRFGTEERRGLGGLGGAFGLGALGLKRPKTQVALTARVIDAATGEIVMSMTGNGLSTKGGGILIGGIGGGIGGGVAITSSEFRESALGEATGRAIEMLAAQIAAKRNRLR